MEMGSLAADFIILLPKDEDRFDAITAFIDIMMRGGHFLETRVTGTAAVVADAFSQIFLKSINFHITYYPIEMVRFLPDFENG